MKLQNYFTVASAPQNAASFETRFAYPINLDSDCTLALKSVFYPQTKNISTKNNKVLICADERNITVTDKTINVNNSRDTYTIPETADEGEPADDVQMEEEEQGVYYDAEADIDYSAIYLSKQIYLTTGFYESPGDLFYELRDRVNEKYARYNIFELCNVQYNSATEKWKFTLPRGLRFKFIEDEQSALDLLFLDRTMIRTSIEITEHILHSSPEMGFLYCDIVENSYINNNLSRLLSIIPLRNHHYYNTRFYEFCNPNYYNVSLKQFAGISFQLLDAMGEEIEFVNNANLILNLHLKNAI